MPVVRPLLLTAVLYSASAVQAAEMTNVRGELTCSSCSTYSNLVVDVMDSSTRQPLGTYVVSSNGQFEIMGVSSGSYLLSVRSQSGDTISTQPVNLGAHTGPLSIALPSSPAVRNGPADGSLVSVHELTHKVPKAAKKEFDRSADSGNDHAKVIAHLEKAVAIDPEYLEALNNLGSRYILTAQYQKAVNVLEKAVKVDASSVFVLTNFAVALLNVQRSPEAEQYARRALQLSPNSVKPQYVLGLTLYAQQKFSDETVGLFRGSQGEYPNSTIALAMIAASRGERTEARNLLNQYLKTAQPERRQQVRQILASLQ